MNRQDAAQCALFACLQCDCKVESATVNFCSTECRELHFEKHLNIWVESDPRLRKALTTYECHACGTTNDNSSKNCDNCGEEWPQAEEWKKRQIEFEEKTDKGLIDKEIPFVEWLINEWRETPECRQSPIAISAIASHIEDQRLEREDLALSIWLDCAVEGLPIALGEYNAKSLRLRHILSTLFIGLGISGALLAVGWKLILAETGFWGNLLIEICAWGVALTIAGSGWRLNRLFRAPDPRTFRWEVIQETRQNVLTKIKNGSGA